MTLILPPSCWITQSEEIPSKSRIPIPRVSLPYNILPCLVAIRVFRNTCARQIGINRADRAEYVEEVRAHVLVRRNQIPTPRSQSCARSTRIHQGLSPTSSISLFAGLSLDTLQTGDRRSDGFRFTSSRSEWIQRTCHLGDSRPRVLVGGIAGRERRRLCREYSYFFESNHGTSYHNPTAA